MTSSKQPAQLDVSKIKMELAHVLNFQIQSPYGLKDKILTAFDIQQQMTVIKANQPKQVGVLANFAIQGIAGDKSEVRSICRCEILFGFAFPDLDQFVQIKKGEQPEMDTTLQITLLSLAYSTARGMLIAQTRGSIFADAILPILPPTALLKESEAKP